MSTFDPDLTFRVGLIAQQLASRDSSFKYQRKLMPGGVCEASAYQVYGYRATCVCLALGNYHNMDEQRRRIAPEFISLDDYHNLIRLLVEVGKSLDDQTVSGRSRLDKLFDSRRALIE
jgi:endoglucanase